MEVKVLYMECLRYVDIAKNSDKYYIGSVEQRGALYDAVFKYGRVGKNPQVIRKTFSAGPSAIALVKRKLEEKMRKGYEPYEIELLMQ